MGALDYITAGANAATNLVGGILGYRSNKKTNENNLKIAREANELQYKMFEEGNAFNRQMAEYQNQWNSVGAQRERLVAAGYNPASLFENNTAPAVGASSVPAPAMHTAQMQSFDPSSYLAILGQNAAAFASAQKDMSEAKGNDIRNANLQAQFDAQINDLVARKLLTEEQASQVRQEVDFKEQNWNALTRHVEQLAYQTQQNARLTQLEADILETYGRQEADARVKKLINEARLAYEQGDTEQAKRKLMDIQGSAELANVAISRMAASALANLHYAQSDLLKQDVIYKKALNETYKIFGKGQAAADLLQTVASASLMDIQKMIEDNKLPASKLAAWTDALGKIMHISAGIRF